MHLNKPTLYHTICTLHTSPEAKIRKLTICHTPPSPALEQHDKNKIKFCRFGTNCRIRSIENCEGIDHWLILHFLHALT